MGDTLFVNGTTYSNVLKTTGLHEALKIVGLAVAIDYRIISADKVTTIGCNSSTPIIYNLKELTILDQGEAR